ncbi:MAG: hypothetical protein SNJ78_03945 [Spirochaetales bacterium]
MAANEKMKEWDFLFAILLFIASLSLIVYSILISLEAMRLTDAVFYTAPGFSTFVIGVILAFLAILLWMEAFRKGGNLYWLRWSNLKTIYLSRQFLDTFLVFLYLCLYMWVFWETVPFTRIRVPFWLSTFLFLFAMMKTFKATSTGKIVVISIVTSATAQFFFGYLAGIPLP